LTTVKYSVASSALHRQGRRAWLRGAATPSGANL
jgi:hypothetical protein